MQEKDNNNNNANTTQGQSNVKEEVQTRKQIYFSSLWKQDEYCSLHDFPIFTFIPIHYMFSNP
jgi:hypothetical protein